MDEDNDNSEKNLFQLAKVAVSTRIRLSAFSCTSSKEIISLVLETGDILFYHNPPFGEQPSVRCIPWFEDPQKKIKSTTFDPVSGNWLLVVCSDSSLYLIPSLIPDSTEVIDPLWCPDDITALPPLCGINKLYDLCPSSIAWWERSVGEGRSQSIAVIGGRRGEILFANFRTGCVVGHTAIEGSVGFIQVCKDITILDSPPVFLLISNENQVQWKLLLEDRETGYFWPLPEQSRTDSSNSLISGITSEDAVSRPAITSFPLARARLQGLKQLSVEKLATLRQKLTETRNRGLGNVSVKRRGSSSSEESLTRHRASVSSDSESLCGSVGSVGSTPRLNILNDTYLTLQHARGKPLIVGHYAPAQLVTMYGVGLSMSPLSVHRLPNSSRHVCITNWLLYTSDPSRNHLSVVSYRLSQCRLDADKQILNSDVNPDSLLQQFSFEDGEEIQALYRLTPRIKEDKHSKHEEHVSHHKKNTQRHSSYHSDQMLDQCAVITNRAIYRVGIRKSPREIVFACVMNPNKIERAERLCHMFGLDLQQLLESAAEKQLEGGHLDSAVALYKLARCRPVKSVLHLAGAGFTQHLLSVTTELLHSMQLSQTESLHLANLSVLTFTEQCLRADKHSETVMTKFREFLRVNRHYDEVLAVSVVGQSGLCSVLEFLCEERYLASHVLEVLARVINCQHSPPLNAELCDGFWECMSGANLCQALVVNPDLAKVHISFVQSRLPAFSQNILQRFANLYDPSQPGVRPALKQLMMESSTEINGGKSEKSEGSFPLSEWLAIYLLACLYLNSGRDYSPSLMDLPPLEQPHALQPTYKEMVSVSPNLVSSGFSHAALVRNGQLYTWGHTASGCLGVGDTLSKTLSPSAVLLFPSLGIQALSVSCGKLHTLALTTNGVYAWGSSQYGQLGVGRTGHSATPRLVDTLYEETIVSVVAGQYHSLALTADGRVYSWGWGVHGQLGHGNVEDCCYPTLIQALTSEVMVSLGGGHAHSLMLSAGGRVWACGSSVFGQLGTGSNLKSSRPVQVFGLPEKIISISTSYFHNLALAASDRLYSWGSSPQVLRLQAQAQKKARFQQQAVAQVSADPDPGPELVISPSTEFKGLPTGRSPASADQTNAGGGGGGSSGASTGPPAGLVGLDDGLSHLSPTLVDTSHVQGRITKVSCGCHHSALLTATGQLYTWGRNLDAQLGNGARTKEALHPTRISLGNGSSEVITVECGGDFTLAVEANGKLWGWGSNQVGQLGKKPVEDASKAGLEGRLLMLKTSKRVIKLPHGSLNTVDVPKEIPSLPTIQIAFQSHQPDTDSIKPLCRLAQLESPSHGSRTLHYALSYFHGFYDTKKLREKCVEVGDYQTASHVALLEQQLDLAMSYQLQAALGASEQERGAGGGGAPSDTSSQPSVLERASRAVNATEVIVPTLEAKVTVNSLSGRKIGLSRTRSSMTEPDPEPEPEVGPGVSRVQANSTDEAEEKSASEIHTFAVQGGAEEMSTRSQDTFGSLVSKSDLVESRCDTPDTLASSGCEDFATKSSEIFDSPVKHCCVKIAQSEESVPLTYETIVNKHIKDLERANSENESCHVNGALIEDLVHIVEFYIDLCEQGPQTSLKALLKQGLKFWTNHNLPVCRLEALLLSHWSLVSYPLGLLLLGNESEVCVDAQQMLSSLSTEFSLQLCSAMVSHVSDAESQVPEVVELLSGLSWPEQTTASLTSQTFSLDQIISQISNQQPAHSYIDIDFTRISEDELTSGEVISFSCGHQFAGCGVLERAATSAARCMDDRSLASTAATLRGLYQQPATVRHFACPNCVARELAHA